jgi:predicted aspartyl protease
MTSEPMDAMGTFRVDVEIENPARPGEKRALRSVLVHTGAELSWVPAELLEPLGVARNNKWRFRQADGTLLERWTGTVVLHFAEKRVGDEMVFGMPGDLTLLGARSLEGLNLRVEPVTKRLGGCGPRSSRRPVQPPARPAALVPQHHRRAFSSRRSASRATSEARQGQGTAPVPRG